MQFHISRNGRYKAKKITERRIQIPCIDEIYSDLRSSYLTIAVWNEPYARFNVRNIINIPCHEEYIVY